MSYMHRYITYISTYSYPLPAHRQTHDEDENLFRGADRKSSANGYLHARNCAL